MSTTQISTDRLEAITSTILQPTAAAGVQGRTGRFEEVIAGLTSLITRHRPSGAEVLRFPPVMSRALLEKSGYLKSFPHLLGVVSSMTGTEAKIRALVEGRAAEQEWVDALAATDLVLTPAACYQVYPIVAARGDVPITGVIVDVESYCFRRETSAELGRMQAFRMREYVCIGAPETAVAFRESWKGKAQQLANQLGLPFTLLPASDPFFGRAGKLMAVNQVEQALKFELLVPVNSDEAPTACMSFNYHQDHFGTTWGLRTDGGAVAHTACAAFGLDRLTIALFATHGLDFEAWPLTVREALGI
ncbi:MAG: amino acid--[acyl-carrier-protein] ligase [Bradyrhizobium sp.]|jgi:seryl-tRNA synthetase|nr:amino acid--[acyl-carrier-protein] ligase [Bradyrhizobium sp.]